RTKWTGIHSNEAFFRDTAHGLLAWATATLLSASVLGAATTHIVGGAAQGAVMAGSSAAQNVNPSELYVDRLFRSDAPAPAAGAAPPAAGVAAPPAAAGNQQDARPEVLRLWTTSFRANRDLRAEDRTYVARVVANRTGLSQAEAEKRVDQVVTEAKQAADRARRAGAQLSFWLTASLLLGAFAASLAAVEGGMPRDGTWDNRVLRPRSI